MSGRTHKSGAICMAVTYSTVLHNNNKISSFNKISVISIIILLIGAIIGSYLPDADTMQSKAGRKLSIVLWPLYLVQAIIKVISYIPGPLNKMAKRIDKRIGHRGIAHTPVFWSVLFSICIMFIAVDVKVAAYLLVYENTFMFSCIIGVISHLLLDLISGKIMLLFPFSTKKYGVKLIETFSFGDYALNLIFIVATGVLIRLRFLV